MGFAAGGALDLLARAYAQQLQDVLGATVIVENRPGAFEQLAAQPVMAAAPDGRTLWLATSGALTMGPGVRPTTPYDILKSFSHIAKIGDINAVLAVRSGLPVNNFSEFITYAQARPGKLNYASAGVGGGNHLMTEYLMKLTRIQMTHVPYRGDADVVRELTAGNADFGIPTVSTAAPFINDGKFKALVATGSSRSKSLPNVPLLEEETDIKPLKHYGVYAIYAVLGPPGMPAATIAQLNEAFAKVARMPAVVAQLEKANIRPATSTPEELVAFIEKDLEKWRDVGQSLKLD